MLMDRLIQAHNVEASYGNDDPRQDKEGSAFWNSRNLFKNNVLVTEHYPVYTAGRRTQEKEFELIKKKIESGVVEADLFKVFICLFKGE